MRVGLKRCFGERTLKKKLKILPNVLNFHLGNLLKCHCKTPVPVLTLQPKYLTFLVSDCSQDLEIGLLFR